MKNRKYISSKIIFGALVCLALQGCKENDIAEQGADTLSQTSVDGGCAPSASVIDSLLVVKSNSENSYGVTHNACTSITSNLWVMNDGRREAANLLNHSYSRSGEYAAEAIAFKRTFKITDRLKKVIVKSCEAGVDCKSIHSADFANLNESISLNLSEADAPASSGLIYSVKDAEGNVSELNSNSFSAEAAGVYEISTESGGNTYKKNISVVDIPANQVGAAACDLKDLMLSGPSESKLNESSYAKVNIPTCLSALVSSIEWSFSDSQSNSYSQSTLFSFTESGDQNYSAKLNLNNGSDPIVLSRNIFVSDEDCTDCPILADDGSNPDRSPASEPGSSCGNIQDGQVVTVGQIITSEIVSCNEGNGQKVITYTQDENRICSSGSLNSTANGEQSILSAGACHSWFKTGATDCTKACGGMQSDIYSCIANGETVASGNNALCGEAPSSEPYLCDGDPDFEEIIITEILEQGEPTVCHSNKQGYIIDKQVTTEVYNCVDHAVTLVDSVTTIEEAPFCMDLKRCSNDSLSPSKAHGRLNWMNNCAADQSKIQDFFDITADFEDAPQNSYTISEDGGTIIGRPTYVTFRHDDGSVWKAPAPGTTNWRDKSTIHSDAAGLSCEIPESANIAGICLSSCVTPSQIIAAGNGAALPIKRAYDSILGNAQTLAPFSTILKPILMSTPVKQFITEVDDSMHDIMIFTMKSGNSIEYTPNHPVVTADGNLKDAADFVIGQSFVRKDGALDEIVKIENIKHFGKVYNVYMQSSVLERNVVVINDYLTGSAYFQNEGHDFVDRQVLRSSLAK